MRTLDAARQACESFLPGLLGDLAEIPLEQLEASLEAAAKNFALWDLACSALFDLPSGAVVVLVMALIATMASFRWGATLSRPGQVASGRPPRSMGRPGALD